jgi:hypothetical protein
MPNSANSDSNPSSQAEGDYPESNPSAGDQVKNCPTSPIPDGYAFPEKPGSDYYKTKLPMSQLEPINGEKDKAIADAEIKKKTAYATAKELMKTSWNNLEVARRAHQSQLDIWKVAYEDNKKQIKIVYRKKLRDATKRNSQDTDIESDDSVPPAQKAIAFAEFQLSLAREDVNYLNALRTLNTTLATAESNWKLAQDMYEMDKCSADFNMEVEVRQAEVKHRQDISKALDAASK